MSKPATCSHAIPFLTRCIECELILARERLGWARDSVEKYTKLITKLEAEQLLAANVILIPWEN